MSVGGNCLLIMSNLQNCLQNVFRSDNPGPSTQRAHNFYFLTPYSPPPPFKCLLLCFHTRENIRRSATSLNPHFSTSVSTLLRRLKLCVSSGRISARSPSVKREQTACRTFMSYLPLGAAHPSWSVIVVPRMLSASLEDFASAELTIFGGGNLP